MSNAQQKETSGQNAAGSGKAGSVEKQFATAFFAQVPAEDLNGWTDADIAAVGKSMFGWAQDRAAKKCKIRVFNPEKKRDGWTAAHTVIQIANDDMPFIIDSLSAEMTHQGYVIETLLHPILRVARDKKGKLSSVQGKGSAEEHSESFVHMQLEQLLTPEACRALAKRLEDVLADVRTATGDWRAMLGRIDAVIAAPETFAAGHDKAHVMESRDFLTYVRSNNFTFLGYREYKFKGDKARRRPEVVKDSDLGILKRHDIDLMAEGAESPELAAMRAMKWPVVVSKLIDQYASVHRRVPLDAIKVKVVDKQGEMVGLHLFVGLFTSSTYSCRTSEVPIVRLKVAETIRNAGFIKGSHDAKALEHILEKVPRDELFEISSRDLLSLCIGVLGLQIRQRIALFTHMHSMRRHLSCLVYIPRDKYTTRYRRRAGDIIEQNVKGRVVSVFTTLDDSPLARILYTVRLDAPPKEAYDRGAIETQLIDLGRDWDELLRDVLVAAYGKGEGAQMALGYGKAFTSAYHESIDVNNAVHDIRHLERMRIDGEDIRVDFYRLADMQPGEFRLKVYHAGSPVSLSDILPVLENMGLKTLSEMPFEVRPAEYDGVIWIHDFSLRGPSDIHLEKVKANFEETFLNVWHGRAENDGLNQLVLRTSLSWHQVMILRAYSGFMRQARFPYSRVYVEQVLNGYPEITQELVSLFYALHDPESGKKSASLAEASRTRIFDMLQQVQKLDHDRILRNVKTLIRKTLRTSYFQMADDGQRKPAIAFKLDSKNIPELPLPRPHVEIFVYSPRVEAVHLRGGEIARGGIRWSDRADDYRTEILGLLKSQMVKNTVIVPVGAKGGFIVKQPPRTGGREAFLKEGIECYKIFVQSLLDITDNSVKGKAVRPKDVVCHDEADPYLVVAADKGTATFSDIANKISTDAGFWMGDAFASGGSAGYDHKEMGITARGGWECVKRHFREIGKDIQKEEFTAVGVGDMGGDVFGNAMLLSKQTRLVGAFNHVHIFCDPEPDAASSYAERLRLFKARGGWDAYNKDLISAGGGVFDRGAKVIKLSPQIRKRFDIEAAELTPDELIRAILKANAELLWLGGIGTYVKGARQSQADADDKSNDNLRIDGRDLRVQVVGEGANLGFTQLGRVEYARLGGRINTDFIDNSAGVDCSDHEVNIKILLNDVMGDGKMGYKQRDKLLADMTDQVAELVLEDNYQQSQSLTLQEHQAGANIGLHVSFIHDLEKAGLIKRQLEGLPDDDTLARMEREGQGLSRPELAVLTSYAKMTIYSQILRSDIPDDPKMENQLFDYFPKALHKYEKEIRRHRLKREIIATQITNRVVNRMGPVFVMSRMNKTGEPATEIVKAFMIVRQAYGLAEMWDRIEALDNKVPNSVQISALHEVFLVVKRAVTWFLRFGGGNLNVSTEAEAFSPGVFSLKKIIRQMAPEDVRAGIVEVEENLTAAGIPAAIASEIATIKLLSAASDIVNISRRTQEDIREIATAYFAVGERLNLDWLRARVSALAPENSWQARVVGGLMDDYFIHQAVLTATIFDATKKSVKIDRKRVEQWFEREAELVGKINQMVNELKAEPKPGLEMFVLVSQRLGALVHVMKG